MPTEHRALRTLVPYLTREEGAQYNLADAVEIVDYGADALWMDLEDFTHPSRVDEARESIGEIVRKLGGEHAVMVRVHEGTDPELQRTDLDALVCQELYGILVPKTQPGQVTRLSAVLDEVEEARGLERGHTRLFPLLEDGLAIEKSYEIGLESSRIAHMGWCTSREGDPSRAIGFRWTPSGDETLYMRSRTLIAARAAGVPHPMSGGWINEDIDGLRRFATRERDLGYLGMACYADPAFIAAVNEIFTPTAEEVQRWQQIVSDEDDADRRGWRHRYTAAEYARSMLGHAERLGVS